MTQAEAHFREARDVWEDALGPDHPDVAVALNNIASALGSGSPAAAEVADLNRRALEIKELQLPPDHPDLAVQVGHPSPLAPRLLHPHPPRPRPTLFTCWRTRGVELASACWESFFGFFRVVPCGPTPARCALRGGPFRPRPDDASTRALRCARPDHAVQLSNYARVL